MILGTFMFTFLVKKRQRLFRSSYYTMNTAMKRNKQEYLKKSFTFLNSQYLIYNIYELCKNITIVQYNIMGLITTGKRWAIHNVPLLTATEDNTCETITYLVTVSSTAVIPVYFQ